MITNILRVSLVKRTAAVLCIWCAAFALIAQQRPDALRMYQQGNYDQAISICEQELRTNPKNMDSYVVLCWALVKKGRYSEAEQRALAARKLNQNDHRIIEILAEAKFYLGKNSESLTLFQEFLSYVSDNAARVGNAYYFMGEIYLRQGRYEHADIALTAAVRIEPLLFYWWMRLGYAREMSGNYKTSALAYDKALELNPSAAEARAGRERIQSKL